MLNARQIKNPTPIKPAIISNKPIKVNIPDITSLVSCNFTAKKINNTPMGIQINPNKAIGHIKPNANPIFTTSNCQKTSRL